MMRSLPLVSVTAAVAACNGGMMRSRSSSVEGLGLHQFLMRSQGPRAMSRFWAVPTILKSRGLTLSVRLRESTKSHQAASTVARRDLPFWRATRTMTRRNR